MKCNVCKKNESVGVCCSVFGAISVAYCRECLDSKREPYGIMVSGLFGMRSLKEIRPELLPYVHATLGAEGKTEHDLIKDIQWAENEYNRALERIEREERNVFLD